MSYFKTSSYRKEVDAIEQDETPDLKGEDFNLLMKLYKSQSPSGYEHGVIRFIERRLRFNRKIKYRRDEIGNILITKGELKKDEFYPCMVAHMDTVHNFEANISICSEQLKEGSTKLYATTYEAKKDTDWYMGSCGDDKNGVWLALLLLEQFDTIKVILTVEEEVGLFIH